MYGKTVKIVPGGVAILKLIRYFDLKTALFDKIVSQRFLFTF